MIIPAIRGAIGFLSRVPVGRSERAWTALGKMPAVMVLVSYLIGVVAAVSFVVFPGFTVAFAYPALLIFLTGISHMDGLADLGDAAAVHGTSSDRLSVMRDTVTGVGGTVAIGLDLLGLALASFALATVPLAIAVGIVIASEVGAKLAMIGLAVLGEPTHRGMGSHLLGAPMTQFVVGIVLAFPAAFLAWPHLEPAIALVGALAGGAIVAAWATRMLGGVSGDVFGATNEVARLIALHAGVIAWTRF